MLCQQTLSKGWFANVNMTSCYDVTNSVCPVTMTTIRHCSILEIGMGASNQAVVPGITRLVHATGYTLRKVRHITLCFRHALVQGYVYDRKIIRSYRCSIF